MFSNSTAARSHHHRTRREWRWAQPLRFLQLPRSGGLLWAVALPGRQNNGVRLRSEPPTIAAAAATGSRPSPISRAAGSNLISRGCDAAAPVAVILAELGGTGAKEVAMNEDVFNASIRKFLKALGVTAQREIEKAVRHALAEGRLKGNETFPARATVTLG